MALRTGCSKRGAALARPSESPLAARHSCSIGSEDVPRLVLPGDLIAHLYFHFVPFVSSRKTSRAERVWTGMGASCRGFALLLALFAAVAVAISVILHARRATSDLAHPFHERRARWRTAARAALTSSPRSSAPPPSSSSALASSCPSNCSARGDCLIETLPTRSSARCLCAPGWSHFPHMLVS